MVVPLNIVLLCNCFVCDIRSERKKSEKAEARRLLLEQEQRQKEEEDAQR